jgi:hypothetical protein
MPEHESVYTLCSIVDEQVSAVDKIRRGTCQIIDIAMPLRVCPWPCYGAIKKIADAKDG